MAGRPEPADWTDPVDPLWQELRANPEAAWISLAFPGFLLRPPYGPEGRRVRSFGFIETVESAGDLLWSNPALLSGVLFGIAFAKAGWGLRLEPSLTLEDAPIGFGPDGSPVSVYAHLSHTASAAVRNRGLVPVIGFRNESTVRIQNVGSISVNQPSLKAWWMGV
jgi:hypothetical protein